MTLRDKLIAHKDEILAITTMSSKHGSRGIAC